MFDTRHFKDDAQRILRFENVRRWHVCPRWDGRLFFRFDFPLLLDLQFLLGSHCRCSSLQTDLEGLVT
jgi:hypothetical protein